MAQTVKKEVINMWKPVAVGLTVVLVIFLVGFCLLPVKEVAYTVSERYQTTETYYESEPYSVMEEHTTTESKSRSLWNGTSFGVSAGHYKVFTVYLDVAGTTGNFVSGTVKSLAGGEFLFYVFDQKNYNAWKSKQSYQPYVGPGRVTNYSFSFVPGHTDYYYFVFSNTFSVFTNKLIEVTARWDWRETKTELREVTKYRSVPKERLVWQTRPVTRYKKVSMLMYLLGE